MPTSPPNSDARLTRWLLPVLLLGYLLGTHHEFAYVHEICAIDGEITHEHHGHDHDHGHDHEEEGHGEEEEEHEHCGLPTLGADPEPPQVGFALEGALGAPLEKELAHEDPILAETVARYLLAPKNSPPSV